MTTLTQKAVIERPAHVVRAAAPLATIDRLFKGAAYGCALFVLVVLLGILGSMAYCGWPVFREFGFFGFLTSSIWDVNNDNYGAWPAVAGTLTTAFIALVIGVPISLGIAIYLTQLAPPWLKPAGGCRSCRSSPVASRSADG